jgi:ribosome-associated protein
VRDAALDLKAEDLIVLPLEGRTIVADAFVIATGRSKIQTRSIADAVVKSVREAGFHVARTEGYDDGGPVVAHIFTPEQRAFYNLERLWGALDSQQARSL